MMKKTFSLHRTVALALSVVMAFSLSACGSSGSSGNGGNAADSNAGTSQDSAAEGTWKPSQTINIVCPFSAGGDTDFNAREYANFLGDILGTNVIVTNVTGASGSIASQQVKDSAPDGYNLLFTTTTFLFNKASGTTDYGMDDFELSCVAGKSAGWCLAVRADSPYSTLKDFCEASHNNTITMASGSGGVSSSSDCIGAQFVAAGTEFRHVEFGAASEKVTGLLGGEVDSIIVPLITAAPYIESGDFRVLCCFEEDRSTYFPDIPTAVENGYDIVNPNYYIAFFPEGTPENIVTTFTDACEQVYNMDAYQTALVDSFSQAPYFERGEEAYSSLVAFNEMIAEVQAAVVQ